MAVSSQLPQFCDCKVWLTRGELGVTYVLFGLKTDAMLGRYLFEVVVFTLRTELAGFKARNPRLRDVGLRRAEESCQHGMVARISARLTADHVARESVVITQRASGTALMLIKQSVVDEAFAATADPACLNSSLSPPGCAIGLSGWLAGRRQGQPEPAVAGRGRPLLT